MGLVMISSRDLEKHQIACKGNQEPEVLQGHGGELDPR